jgi:TPR repeat protein
VFPLELREASMSAILLERPRQEATMVSMYFQTSEDRTRNARRELCKAAFFKQTEGGHIYRAPNPYVFGRGKHYIVTEAQREAILDVLVPAASTQAARFAKVLGLGVIGLLGLSLLVGLLDLYTSRLPGAEYAVLILGVLLIPLLAAVLAMTHRLAILQLAELQPILANAPATDQRITNADVVWSLQTSGDRKGQQHKAIVGGIVGALISVALLGAAVLSWPKHGAGFSYVLPVFLGTMAALSLISTAAVLCRTVTPAGAGARTFDRALRRMTLGVTAIFLAIIMVRGGLLLSGTIETNYTEMLERAEVAAANGDAEAMARLGWLYRDGKGVAQNYAKAQEWYEKSAGAGNTDAMVSLGAMFHNGLAGPRDYVKARVWFDRAAAAGNSSAMDWIGWNYQNGFGVARDFAVARHWYEQAAATGYSPAQHHLGMMYSTYAPEDYAKAREWFLKAAAAGNGGSMVQLGLMSINGFGTTKDTVAARAWYERAISAGNLDAMQWLANMLDQGNGGPTDQLRAARLLLQAAKRGHTGSRTALEGPLSFVTPQTRVALKGELAKLGHYSGAIDDVWDATARAAYHVYVGDHAAARPDRAGCLSFHEVHPMVSAKEVARTQVPPGFNIYPATSTQNEGLLLRVMPVVSGSELSDAQAGLDARTGEPIVTFRLNAVGARKLDSYTRDNVGRPIAIVLEGRVLSAPVIRAATLGGRGQISANFTTTETQRIAAKLKTSCDG